MASPLAFSGIALSHSRHSSSSGGHSHSSNHSRTDGAAKRHYDAPPTSASNPLPVLVHVRKERVLLAALLGGGATCALMLVFSRGVVVARFEAGAATSSTDDALARRQRRVDDLNFYLGAVTALTVKPLLATVALVVPVALLCFATRAYMQTQQRSWKAQTAMFVVANAVVWLLTNGFHGANVHLTAPRVRSVLRSADLSSEPPFVIAESGAVNGTSAVAAVDTILRAAIRPQQQPFASAAQCSRASPRRLPALVEFGFVARDWFRSALPTAPPVAASLKRKVSALPATTAPLPLAAASARSLFAATLVLMNDFFRDPTTTVGAADTAAFELEPASSREGDAALFRAMHAKLRAVFNASAALFPHFAAFDADNAALQFDRYALSPQIAFESLTLDVPLAASELRRRVVLEPGDDTTREVVYGNDAGVFEINPKEECGALGCVVSIKGERLSAARVDSGSQVRAFAICVDSATGAEDWSATLDATGACATTSNGSALVFSFAKRITGDALEVALNRTAGVVTLTNPLKHYTVTVGRLSWAASDLAETFHASCDAGEGCDGLTFPLPAEAREPRRHLLVGTAQLPVARKYAPPEAADAYAWGTPLVSSNVQEIDDGSALKSDLVLPRNFQRVDGWDGAIAGARCEVERGALLDRIVRGRLYSEDSLQPAYTAALFWLLQHAAVARASPTGDATPAFSGDVQVVEAELSVPRFSAVLTCSGCAVLLLLGVAVQLGGKRREAHIERFFSAHHLARLVLGDAALPRRLVTCDLLSVATDRFGSSARLDALEICGLALRHPEDPGSVLRVPPPPSTSASSSFLSAAA